MGARRRKTGCKRCAGQAFCSLANLRQGRAGSPWPSGRAQLGRNNDNDKGAGQILMRAYQLEGSLPGGSIVRGARLRERRR